jgi:hypothetical protein
MASTTRVSDPPGACPFLAPVLADRLWLRPLGAYCRCPDGRAKTLAHVCSTMAHRTCPGYQESFGAVATHGAPEPRFAGGDPVRVRSGGAAGPGAVRADGHAREGEVAP